MLKIKNKKDILTVLVFLLPAVMIYTVFQIIPLVQAGYFSVTNWNGIAGSAIEFAGLDNFKTIFKSPDFLLALKNMFKMVIFSVLFHTPAALLLAVALNTRCRGFRIFKAMYFVPTVFPLSAVGLMWYFIFMPTGAINAFLDVIGLSDMMTPWLVNESTAMNSIIFVNIWAGIGYYMVILLAGLTSIPEDVYEAAAIDGAGRWKRMLHITLPGLKTVIVLMTILALGNILNAGFDQIYNLYNQAVYSTGDIIDTWVYRVGLNDMQFSLATAVGLLKSVAGFLLISSSYYIANKKANYTIF